MSALFHLGVQSRALLNLVASFLSTSQMIVSQFFLVVRNSDTFEVWSTLWGVELSTPPGGSRIKVWTYVRITTAINKYSGRHALRFCKYPTSQCFPSKFSIHHGISPKAIVTVEF